MSYTARLIGSILYIIVCSVTLFMVACYFMYIYTPYDVIDMALTNIGIGTVQQVLMSIIGLVCVLVIYLIVYFARPLERR
jgi:hypothetical protein